MKFREIEKILLSDGWRLKNIKGSHYHYIHPEKPGKVTVPNHGGDLDVPKKSPISSKETLFL